MLRKNQRFESIYENIMKDDDSKIIKESFGKAIKNAGKIITGKGKEVQKEKIKMFNVALKEYGFSSYKNKKGYYIKKQGPYVIFVHLNEGGKSVGVDLSKGKEKLLTDEKVPLKASFTSEEFRDAINDVISTQGAKLSATDDGDDTTEYGADDKGGENKGSGSVTFKNFDENTAKELATNARKAGATDKNVVNYVQVFDDVWGKLSPEQKTAVAGCLAGLKL